MRTPAHDRNFRSDDHNHERCLRDAVATAAALCAQRGARLTPLRRQVLELVWARHAPVLAYDLLDQLRARQRRAAPATVYRALDFLLQQGLIHRIESLNAYVGCVDPYVEHAGQFLICNRCRSVAELDDSEIGEAVQARATAAGFLVMSPTVEIRGICPACAS